MTLPETKNGEKRIVPLSMEALRILSGIPRRLDGSVWGITEDPISRVEAACSCQASLDQPYRLLQKLVKEGKLRKVGEMGRAVQYELETKRHE
ncbi:MAG: hypothetical protein ACYCTV_06600 [Leptospirales bacterium]